MTSWMLLNLEDCFCWNLQTVPQVLFFTWDYTELIVSSHPHTFITDFRFVLILLALDDTLACGDCHKMSIPESLAIACAVVSRRLSIAGTSS